MSERAYSEELNEEMSAFKAHKYSLEGKLKSAKAFHCHDRPILWNKINMFELGSKRC